MTFDAQDILLKMFPHGGYFVEAGAHDGVGDSQTLRLERAGWGGLCVEPSSAYHGLVRSRKCRTDSRCLWAHDDQVVEFREVYSDVELSGIKMHFDDGWDRSDGVDLLKRTVKLSTLLAEVDAPKRFEFLCLDTEGSELDILLPHRFDWYSPRTLLVEHNMVQRRMDRLVEHMSSVGYILSGGDDDNFFFVHRGSP